MIYVKLPSNSRLDIQPKNKIARDIAIGSKALRCSSEKKFSFLIYGTISEKTKSILLVGTILL